MNSRISARHGHSPVLVRADVSVSSWLREVRGAHVVEVEERQIVGNGAAHDGDSRHSEIIGIG